ncbi:hypothetical protein SAMN04488005_1530 [Yoonia tamlensis]|uniref:Uncharacterized protein n=1 Tax=Yoonia tamlensis TaxID=390270 RepID=A0A1I6GEJ1_9RHOB|nr:hypothetical protein [Yoonia tamlensis]SFR40625.1 hypothetical protein SAMN04488005_1530 [Yoonia tamlensis]
MQTQKTTHPPSNNQSLRDIVTDPQRCADDPQLRRNTWQLLMNSRGKSTNHKQIVKMQRAAGLYGPLAQDQIRTTEAERA